MKNYYEILEVDTNASQEVIEKAYKVLVRKYHPDIQPKDKQSWAEKIFKEITIAYETLSDKYLRQEYDNKLGLNQDEISYQQKYDNLHSEKEKLEQEINQLKLKNESKKFGDNKKGESGKHPFFKAYTKAIGNLIYNETKKSKSERAKDFKALGLTIVIVAILIFIFLKVPFLRNFLFPS